MTMEKVFVIKAGGKQYRVSSGDRISVEKLDKKPKDIVEFENLLGVAKVKAEVLETKLAPKVSIFKFKSKTGYRKKMGHRQPKTFLKIL